MNVKSLYKKQLDICLVFSHDLTMTEKDDNRLIQFQKSFRIDSLIESAIHLSGTGKITINEAPKLFVQPQESSTTLNEDTIASNRQNFQNRNKDK